MKKGRKKVNNQDKPKPMVLVADDEDFFRIDLAGALRFFDFEVQEACNGQEFFDSVTSLLKNQKVPDVFIVDNQMPNQPGEADSQWCGFERIKDLCTTWKDVDLGKRVLFLSRWGLIDLPDRHRGDENAKKLGLLEEERWLPVHTPFFILRSRIEEMLRGRL
jgi:hypothetical protein